MSVFYGVKLDLDFREFELFLKEREGRLVRQRMGGLSFVWGRGGLPNFSVYCICRTIFVLRLKTVFLPKTI